MSLLHEIKPSSIVEISYLNPIHERDEHKIEYVGCVSSELMIFNLASNRDALYKMKMLGPGVVISARLIVGNDALTMISFKTDLISVSTVHIPMLFVSYPKEFQQRKLRAEPRLKVELIAKFRVHSTNEEYLALVTDISKSGIQCEYLPSEQDHSEAVFDADPKEKEVPSCKTSTPANLSSVRELADKDVTILFPAESEGDMDTEVRGVIKNIRGKEKLAVGIQFNPADIETVKSFYAILLLKEHGL